MIVFDYFAVNLHARDKYGTIFKFQDSNSIQRICESFNDIYEYILLFTPKKHQ